MQSNTGHTVYGNPSSIPHVCSACRSAPRLSAASTLASLSRTILCGSAAGSGTYMLRCGSRRCGRRICVYDIVKVCRKGEAGGGLLWPAYILAARNNSFIFLFLCPRISERRRSQQCTFVYIQFLFFPQHILKTPQSNEEAARSTHPSAYQQWCQGEP